MVDRYNGPDQRGPKVEFPSVKPVHRSSVASMVTRILWVSDFVHDFGEGDEILGCFGIGILLGGTFGFLAFIIRNASARLALSVAPHLCFGIGYAAALHAMSS